MVVVPNRVERILEEDNHAKVSGRIQHNTTDHTRIFQACRIIAGVQGTALSYIRQLVEIFLFSGDRSSHASLGHQGRTQYIRIVRELFGTSGPEFYNSTPTSHRLQRVYR